MLGNSPDQITREKQQIFQEPPTTPNPLTSQNEKANAVKQERLVRE